MVDILDDLKAQARRLQAHVQDRKPAALVRLRALPKLREADDAALAATVKRRHCLAVLARELGFDGWPHAVAVLGGESVENFGKLLYPAHFSSRLNIWCATYDEAREIRADNDGYLLAYQRHWFVAESGFIEALGLDPQDADWERIGRDWARPKDLAARTRLYGKLVVARQADAATR